MPHSFPATLAAAIALVAAIALPSESQLRWHECAADVPRLKCATMSVPEDREARDGRRIDVALAVIPATGGTRRQDDPLLVLLGGPGDSPLGRPAAFARDLAAINQVRDIILVDQRGTGRSAPLSCFLGSDDDLQSYMNEFIPLAAVRECLATLRSAADPRHYRTRDFIADLEEIRSALGVRRWNLHAVSYGTRVALQYMARHPAAIRSAILIAPVPPELVMPVSFGEDADRALQLIAADCRADSACAAAFPRFEEEAREVAARLARQPVATAVDHPVSGAKVPVTMSRGTFGEVMRAAMYTPQGARSLPLMVHEAYRGDFTAAAAAALRRQRTMARAGWAGLYLAVTCVEDVPRADSTDTYARNLPTILGDGRARQHLSGCAGWPVRGDGDDWPKNPTAPAPTLLIVGDHDPATPPRWAGLALAHTPNGRLVVVPQGGHGFPGMQGAECLARMQAAFVATPDPRTVDAACVAQMKRLPFITTRQATP